MKKSFEQQMADAKRLTDYVADVEELFGGKCHREALLYEYNKDYAYCKLIVRVNLAKSRDFENVTATFVLTDGRVAGLAKHHCVVKDVMSVEFVKDCLGLAKVFDESVAKFFSGLADSIYKLNEVDYGREEG